MKLSIRMKIFLPMMTILIIFTLAVLGVFRYSLEGHMVYNARRDLEHTMRVAEEILADEEDFNAHGSEAADVNKDGSDTGGSNAARANTARAHADKVNAAVSNADNTDEDDSEPTETMKEDGRSLEERLENAVQAETGNTRMMILSERYRVIYPKNYDNQQETDQLYTFFLTTKTQEEDGWEENKVLEENIEEDQYLICYKLIPQGQKEEEQARYILLYCPIQDMSSIMEELSKLLFITMSVIAMFAIVVLWFVCGSISGPVTRLSAAARGIGEKKFRKVETGATVTELCELEDEINRMQEKLFQADQAERTFFQNASHELRTPLMSISGYAQGIQCGVFEDISQAAGVILDESTRLTEVVDGILTLTRMDQSRYQIVPVEIVIEHFLEERLERLEGFAYSKNKKLVFLPGKEHTIVTDVMLLERAFSNVASNCIRYASKEVTVTTGSEDEKVIVTVRDDGPGLKESDLEHIFDRFYKGKGGNHGLGLAIARCSLEYMGASVEASASPVGAVFRIILPQDCRSFASDEAKELW